jgi:hypothetical protein
VTNLQTTPDPYDHSKAIISWTQLARVWTRARGCVTHYSDAKVAKRETKVGHFVIENVPRGFGFVHHSIAIFCRAVPNLRSISITIRHFFIAVRTATCTPP